MIVPTHFTRWIEAYLTLLRCRYTLDLCHLANVTIVAKFDKKVEEEVEVEVEMTEGASEVTNTAEGDANPESQEEEESKIPTILG